ALRGVFMSKELVISATPHETRVAILEDGHLCEIYIEREKEFALVGSIYKGRVTRVLPGMQSAFVDIGRDTDAFLYVSDFLENLEDYDHVPADEVKAQASAPAAAAPAAIPYAAPTSVAPSGGTSIGLLEGETLGAASSASTGDGEQSAQPPLSGEPTSAPYSQTIGVAPDFDPTSENPAHGIAAEPPDSSIQPEYHAPTAGITPAPSQYPTARPQSGQYDRPRSDRGFGGGGRGGRDRGGKFRRGGGRDRGGRPHGRDLPASKYASPGSPRGPYSPQSSFAPRDNRDDSSASAENLPPIILPGESLAKYKERPPVTSFSPRVTDSFSAQQSISGTEQAPGFGEETNRSQNSESELPSSLYAQPETVTESATEARELPLRDGPIPMHEEVTHDAPVHDAPFSMSHEEVHETEPHVEDVKDSHDPYAVEDDRPGMGLTHDSPADLTDEQARTLAESLAEAKHEEAHDELDDQAALATGEADFTDPESAMAEVELDDAEANGNVHDDDQEDGAHEAHDEAADLAHDEAHNANIDAGVDAEAVHAAGESSELSSAEQQHDDQKFNREPRSARVEDPRRNARFQQRPMRRGGPRGGRPMRHGRPPDRHGRPSSGGH